ncbi:MAG: hypothetical protein JNK21_01080 [Rhodospirillaceae bacterium]|nr:hypothetical protein [Rhodospirillaceae bacterium]
MTQAITRLIGIAALVLVASAAWAQTAPAEGQTSAANAPKERRAVPDTLMFTIDEYNEIKDRQAGGDVTEAAREKAEKMESLFLGSIMYYGPKDWTIWINGAPIGPNQDFQSFQVTDITPRYVELLVPLSVQGMRPVRLEPNQTFIAESGIIVEGRYP